VPWCGRPDCARLRASSDPLEVAISRRAGRVSGISCEQIGGIIVPTKGSALRAEANQTLRTVCASCGKSIPTEIGHAHPLDEDIRRETWALMGHRGGREAVFPTCTACHAAGWLPPQLVALN
jgi:hypothetical protein